MKILPRPLNNKDRVNFGSWYSLGLLAITISFFSKIQNLIFFICDECCNICVCLLSFNYFSNHLQTYSLTATAEFRKKFVKHIASLGMVLNMLEVSAYITLFHYLINHNNNIASAILQPSVIKQRNQTNAITMFGQMLAWLMEVWYAFFIGILSAYYDIDTLREVASLLKTLEFFLIPLVEVHTSKPIRDFCSRCT